MAIAQIDFISAGQAYHVCTAMPLCPKVLLVTDALERRKKWTEVTQRFHQIAFCGRTFHRSHSKSCCLYFVSPCANGKKCLETSSKYLIKPWEHLLKYLLRIASSRGLTVKIIQFVQLGLYPWFWLSWCWLVAYPGESPRSKPAWILCVSSHAETSEAKSSHPPLPLALDSGSQILGPR